MKLKTLLLALLLIGTSFASDYHVKPSKTITKEQITIENFDKIEVSDAFKVYVTFSDTDNKIVVEANENLHPYVITKISNNKLIVKLKSAASIKGDMTLMIHITVPKLQEIELSNAANMEFTNQLISSNLKVRLSGAASLKGNVSLEEGSFKINEAANLNLSGKVKTAVIETNKAAGVDGYNCEVETLKATLEGASSVKFTVSKAIEIKASGASSLNYKGNAIISYSDVSGAAVVKKKQEY